MISPSDKAHVSALQKCLHKLGFYKDTLTGLYDEHTRDALKEFQSNENLTLTGFADERTLDILAFRCSAACETDIERAKKIDII